MDLSQKRLATTETARLMLPDRSAFFLNHAVHSPSSLTSLVDGTEVIHSLIDDLHPEDGFPTQVSASVCLQAADRNATGISVALPLHERTCVDGLERREVEYVTPAGPSTESIAPSHKCQVPKVSRGFQEAINRPCSPSLLQTLTLE